MRCFIKTERFNESALKLPKHIKVEFIQEHVIWAKRLKQSGVKISSGYLVNKDREPGGGGLLVVYANSYLHALEIIKQDPMIKNNLVIWELNEWIGSDKIFSEEFYLG